MKILIIDKSVFRGKISDCSSPLIRHLLFWHEHNNEVSVLARIDKYIVDKLNKKLIFIKLPPRILFLSTYFAYYYLILKSRKYDLVVEVWGNKPNFRLIYNTKRSLIVTFSNKFRNIVPSKIFKLIYKKNKFLVNSSEVQDKLINLGIRESFIRNIPNGVENKKDLRKRSGKKNKILIVCGKDVDGAVNLISLIERRSLDWKFFILTEKKYVTKLKSLYDVSGLTSGMKAMAKADYNFNKNVKNSKYAIITKDVKNILDYINSAFLHKTPVLIEGTIQRISKKGVRDLVLSYENKMDLASEVIALSKNKNDYNILSDKISKSIQFQTWDEVCKLGLEYIESL